MTRSGHNRGYLHGAAILAAGVMIARVIGAVYRIPVQNIIGDVGSSTFGVAHSIYTVLLSLSAAGLPVALSKMISSAEALGRIRQVRRVFSIGRNTFFAIGVLSFLIMAIFHRQLAFLLGGGSTSAAYAILVLSPAVLFVCFISAYRGYFQGLSNMVPTSVSQIIEALARLVFGLSLAWLLMRRGFSSPIIVAGTTFGITTGTVIACVYLFFKKRKSDISLYKNGVLAPHLDTPDSNRRIFKNLLDIAIPLTLGGTFFHIVHMVDNGIILSRLQNAAGHEYEMAQSLHGTYQMTMSMFNLPSSVVVPLTMALLPAISAFLARGDHLSAKKTSESGLRITALLALPAAVGLVVLADPIMHAIYYGRFNAAVGAGLMAYMGASAFFLCFFQGTNCVLQAHGFQRYTVYTLTIGGIIKLVLNWFMLADPRFGIYGAAISALVCYVVISVINMILVKRRIPNPPSFLNILTKPLLCTAVMGVSAWASYGLLFSLTSAHLDGLIPNRILYALPLAGAIVIAVAVYLVLIIALRAITLEDMKMLPKGERLAKILRVR